MKKNLLGLTLSDLQKIFKENSFPAFASKQVYDWIYRKYEFDINNWSNISKALKQFLLEYYSVDLPHIVLENKSVDGTTKLIVQFSDGKSVETVLIPATDRQTVCISSQVGCAMGCTFCHTGCMGFDRNLDSSEIVGQFMALLQRSIVSSDDVLARPSNIVFMGQGEPFHNFENVKKSVEIFMEPIGLGIGQRKITVSTCGIISKIRELDTFPPVNLAISLHSPFDQIRSELMPINKSNRIKDLIGAISKLHLKANRYVTYEYLLIDGLNDREDDVRELISILDARSSKINLIPFNSFPGSKYNAPTEQKIVWFKNRLLEEGYVCTMRVSKGQDILAACGQLNSKFVNKD